MQILKYIHQFFYIQQITIIIIIKYGTGMITFIKLLTNLNKLLPDE